MSFFQMRVTTEQREQLKEAAEAKGMTSAEYVRSLVPELQSAGRATSPQRSEAAGSTAAVPPPPVQPEASDTAGSSGINFDHVMGKV